ncbi:PREDICTED: uncharacterized protein LOC109208988 [Nicotiana attenuata]|uniref:uncharacterized protein LOC109208988 n=1 Tax=Nicotiana attenuata TaxID=49451 RepID=UPI000904921B|nr:PREDICTED: uncharacterized protein LOC109208988 [Nicotiana attenuata]
MVCQARTFLWLQDKENLVEYRRTHMKIHYAKLLKWKKFNQLKKVKIVVNQLMHLHQSWDLKRLYTKRLHSHGIPVNESCDMFINISLCRDSMIEPYPCLKR